MNSTPTREAGKVVWRMPDGIIHRVGGPAVYCDDGTKRWYQNGHLHRTDGPAWEYPDGSKGWFINGESMSYQRFCLNHLMIHLKEYKDG